MSLERIDAVLSSLQAPALALHPEYCARIRHVKSSCRACLLACPTGALKIKGQSLQLDPYACHSCGACATACRTGAIEAIAPDDSELLAMVKSRLQLGALSFTCRQGPPLAEPSIELLCLARLNEAVLLGALVQGAAVIQLHSRCSACADGANLQTIQQMVTSYQRLLRLLEVPGKITLQVEEQTHQEAPIAAAEQGSTRRAMLQSVLHGTKRAAMTTMAAVVAPKDKPEKLFQARRALPASVPARRTLFLSALKGLGQPGRQHGKQDFFYELSIGESCTGCAMCAYFCPSGALQIRTDREGQRLEFNSAICTGCRLCQDICFKQAITLSPAASLATSLQVFRMPQQNSKTDWLNELFKKP